MPTLPSPQNIAIGVAAITAVGILLHDTKMDQATSAALAIPAVIASFELGNSVHRLEGDSHTHTERVSVANALRALHAGTPRIQPREEHRKYRVQRTVKTGGHMFGGYSIPADA